jgi:hypothetical protein
MPVLAHSGMTNRSSVGLQRRTEPSRNAGEAWFGTMTPLIARRDDARYDDARYTANNGRTARPCEPDDVIKCLDTLYRRRRIDLVHAKIMRIWGERQIPPNPIYVAERSDWRLWREALDRLEWPLRGKGIVA